MPEGRAKSERMLVPIEELIDVAALVEPGRPLTPRRIREALPRGWALADDNQHAYRDARLFFREGWILMVGLIVFGSVGGAFVLGAMPKGWAGALRLFGLLIGILILGGVVAPMITRALNRR